MRIVGLAHRFLAQPSFTGSDWRIRYGIRPSAPIKFGYDSSIDWIEFAFSSKRAAVGEKQAERRTPRKENILYGTKIDIIGRPEYPMRNVRVNY